MRIRVHGPSALAVVVRWATLKPVRRPRSGARCWVRAPLAAAAMLLALSSPTIALDCESVDAFGFTFYPLDCIPIDDGTQNVKGLLEGYIDELIASGVNLSKGSVGGAWDCSVDGAQIWVFLDDPLGAQSWGFTFSEGSIALRWDVFFESDVPVDIASSPDFFAGLLAILFHELYHTVFLEWLESTCAANPDCKAAWACVEGLIPDNAPNPCFEFFSNAETARDLCLQACLQPAGSELREAIAFQADYAAGEALKDKTACDLMVQPVGPCPPPPLPPSSFSPPGEPITVPSSCCCAEGMPKEDCEDCDAVSGDCQDE